MINSTEAGLKASTSIRFATNNAVLRHAFNSCWDSAIKGTAFLSVSSSSNLAIKALEAAFVKAKCSDTEVAATLSKFFGEWVRQLQLGVKRTMTTPSVLDTIDEISASELPNFFSAPKSCPLSYRSQKLSATTKAGASGKTPCSASLLKLSKINLPKTCAA